MAGVADFGAAREYWDGGGDASVAFDTEGNAYLSCQVFNRGRPPTTNADISSALLLYRSTGNGGASWNFPGRYVRASADVTGTGVSPFLDKQLMTVDNHVGSPYQDRIYVTWTEFAADGSAFIYEAYSADYGEHFSAPHAGQRGPARCACKTSAPARWPPPARAPPATRTSSPSPSPARTAPSTSSTPTSTTPQRRLSGDDGDAGEDGADRRRGGTAAAAPADNRNQMLLSKSTDGGNTFSAPVKVSDYYDLPDCATYQDGKDPGRACVPEKGATSNSYFRAANYPSGAVDPTNPNKVVVTFGSYINRHSNEANGCVPTGFSRRRTQPLHRREGPGRLQQRHPGQRLDRQGRHVHRDDHRPAAAADGHAPIPARRRTDQLWQWIDFTPTGKLATSYYDRQYGNDETTGYSDVSLSGSKDLVNSGSSG